MKTIFITSFHQLISRNILSTALPELLAKDKKARAVVSHYPTKTSFFQREFSGRPLIMKPMAKRLSWRDRLMRYVSLAALRTGSLDQKRKAEMRGSGAWTSLLFSTRPGRRLVRIMNPLLTPSEAFDSLLEAYKPEAVFLTDIQNEHDVRLGVAAQKRKIPVVGMVRSWDNLTSKGLLCLIPDRLVVQNEIAKREAIELHGIPAARIEVVGIPHYDAYVEKTPHSRAEFLRTMGVDPAKKFVLFVPVGDRYIPRNDIDRTILEILDANLDPSVQILVRFPPADTVDGLDGLPNRGRIFFDRPRSTFKAIKKTELGKEADMHLIDTLASCDAVVTGPSTIAVDAVFFGKPVVLANLDGHVKRPYAESISRLFDYNHWDAVRKSGGVREAHTPEELIAYTNEYLLNPERDAEERKLMAREQCGFLDGNSTERLAKAIESFL